MWIFVREWLNEEERGGGGKDENEGERSGWTAAGGEWNPVSGVEPGLRDFDRRTGFEAKRGCTAQGVPR